MGTPDFAVPSLDILVKNGYKVVGVVTATDKYGGRGGKKLIESAVKKYAVANDIPVLQPKNLKSPEFIDQLCVLDANLQIVVAFRMLPVVVWDMPTLGTFNLHGSLLPRYRGAAPINWAVIRGDKETGVTTFFLKHQIDTGDMIMQAKLPIGENETAGELHDRMMELGATTVLETVKLIEDETVTLQPQNDSLVTKAPKIYHETCEINFNQPTATVHNFIRGLSPYPTAWTTLHNKKLKIFDTRKELIEHNLTAGTFVPIDKKRLKIATEDGFIEVLELQLAGKKRMKTQPFLNGYQEF